MRNQSTAAANTQRTAYATPRGPTRAEARGRLSTAGIRAVRVLRPTWAGRRKPSERVCDIAYPARSQSDAERPRVCSREVDNPNCGSFSAHASRDLPRVPDGQPRCRRKNAAMRNRSICLGLVKKPHLFVCGRVAWSRPRSSAGWRPAPPGTPAAALRAGPPTRSCRGPSSRVTPWLGGPADGRPVDAPVRIL
jgi:hypothetical protein